MAVLEIGGRAMPKVKGLTIGREPIWSKNAGRVADGTMKGVRYWTQPSYRLFLT